MLQYRRMHKTLVRCLTVVSLAFLISSSGPLASAGTLREEAIEYRTQGYEAQQRGDRANALALYQKSAALDSHYPTPHNDAGVILEEEGRLEEAEAAYRQALSLNPSYLEAHANIAMLYERMGEKEKAVYHWLKRYRLGDPHDPWTARAEERLVALGVLKDYPGIKGVIYTRRRLLGEEFESNQRKVEEFRAVTEESGRW